MTDEQFQALAPYEQTFDDALHKGRAKYPGRTVIQSFLSVTEISAAASGAVLAMLVALGNMTSSLPMVLLAVWQLGWTVALGIMSRRSFRTREKGNKNAEE